MGISGWKIEAGETSQQALVREITEELSATIEVGDLIETVEYDYPDFHLSMDCFWCSILHGNLVLLEAEDAKMAFRRGAFLFGGLAAGGSGLLQRSSRR